MKERAECEVCGRFDYLEEHHLIPGIANRKLSDKYGLKKKVCRPCHNKIHNNKDLMEWSKQEGQKKFELTHSREEFIRIFGRSYL